MQAFASLSLFLSFTTIVRTIVRSCDNVYIPPQYGICMIRWNTGALP